MFAQVLAISRAMWKVLKIRFWVLEGILMLGVALLVLGFGRSLLPDLRPCTKTTMGGPAEHRDGHCAGWRWFGSARTSSSCGDR